MTYVEGSFADIIHKHTRTQTSSVGQSVPSRSKLSTSKVIIPTLSCSTIPSPSVVARFDVQTSLTARLPRKTRCTQQEGGRGDRRRLIKTATACVENDTDGVASARSMTHISTVESESPDCAIPTDSLEYYFFRSRGTRLSKGHAWPRDALGRGPLARCHLYF